MKRCCGIDLNGWRDTAWRNWTIAKDGEELPLFSPIRSGVFTSLVSVGDREMQRWIGGYQAVLAPHGRGPGWGDIGDSERRVAIRKLLADSDADVDLLATALSGLGHRASHAVLAVDDTPHSNETLQEKLHLAMHRAGFRRRLLVWRSVLAVLAFILPLGLRDGDNIGVINHNREGFAIQTLLIRRAAGQIRSVLAPERRSGGWIAASDAGYVGLEKNAIAVVKTQIASFPCGETSRTIGRLALGLNAPSEILLTDRCRWEKLGPLPPISLPPISLSDDVLRRLSCCSKVVLESLTTGKLRATIIGELEKRLGRKIVELPEFAVAAGALEAVERLVRDEPIYFDFLPQISTIVIDERSNLPENYDLIEADATLPAGRIYRSSQPAKFWLDRGRNSLLICLKKENAKWPRQVLVDLRTKLGDRTPLEVSVEQMPLSGRARILLRSTALSRQHDIDWSTAGVVKQNWQSLIKELEEPVPTIPPRLVLACGMDAWNDSNKGNGLLSILRKYDGARTVHWDILAKRLSLPRKRLFCISSDGAIPPEVPSEAKEQLERLTKRAVIEEIRRLERKNREKSTARIKFLLCQFRRCPEVIVEQLIRCISDSAVWNSVFWPWSQWKPIFLGVGRCASGNRLELEIASHLLSTDNWRWYGEIACAAYLLSMSDTAPKLLNFNDVKKIANVVICDFNRNRGSNYTTFYYTPLLMVGLLRWRMEKPRALIEGHCEIANLLAETVRETLDDIASRAHLEPKLKKFEEPLNDILKELRGEGTPDLPRKIDEIIQKSESDNGHEDETD